MTRSVSKLKEVKEHLQTRIEVRKKFFNDKTELWKDSEKGFFYNEGTELLERNVRELELLINDLNEWREIY